MVRRWVEVASLEDIAEAIDVPSPVGTALCMAAALKKEHEKGNFRLCFYCIQQILKHTSIVLCLVVPL